MRRLPSATVSAPEFPVGENSEMEYDLGFAVTTWSFCNFAVELDIGIYSSILE